LPDGARLTWSCADGSRGRRWRAVATVDGVISQALLLEVDLAGRPARLELTTPAGMLTLHPSPDQAEIHGNIVSTAGDAVEGLALRWGPEFELDVVGRPIAIAVGLHRRKDSVRFGQTIRLDLIEIGPGLEVTTARRRVERLGEGSWRVLGAAGLPDRRIEIRPTGLPAAGVDEPLEID
jgi:hypothetical protein